MIFNYKEFLKESLPNRNESMKIISEIKNIFTDFIDKLDLHDGLKLGPDEIEDISYNIEHNGCFWITVVVPSPNTDDNYDGHIEDYITQEEFEKTVEQMINNKDMHDILYEISGRFEDLGYIFTSMYASSVMNAGSDDVDITFSFDQIGTVASRIKWVSQYSYS